MILTDVPILKAVLVVMGLDNGSDVIESATIPADWEERARLADAELRRLSSAEAEALAMGEQREQKRAAKKAPNADAILQAAFDAGPLAEIFFEPWRSIHDAPHTMSRLDLALAPRHARRTFGGVEYRRAVTLKSQRDWLYVASVPEPPTVKQIIKAVADRYAVSTTHLLSPRRSSGLVHIRHVAFYLAVRMTGLSFAAIGRLFADRDHTSIMHAFKKMEAARAADRRLARELAALEATIAAEQQGRFALS